MASAGPRKVDRYGNRFKIQAVKLASHPEFQVQDVARALDIHPFVLSKWTKDYCEGKLEPAAAGLGLPRALRLTHE
jgi:transposase